MTATTPAHDPACPPGSGCAPVGCACPAAPADAAPVERNRYFTGKYMSARDFTDEQAYFLNRERFRTRLLHGWGIVCGLEVRRHPDPDCAALGFVVIYPGYAIDCHGRELIVPEAVSVNLRELVRYDTCEPGDPGAEGKAFLLGLRYGEVLVEDVPLLVEEGGCHQRTAKNRVREKTIVCYREYQGGKPLDDGSKTRDDCWDPPTPPAECDKQEAPPGDCFDLNRPGCSPLKADCPCGAMVPLALVEPTNWPKPTEPHKKVKYEADCSGRKYVAGPCRPDALTRIIGTNWKHGDILTPGDLEWHDNDWVRLRVVFERSLSGSLVLDDGETGGDERTRPDFYRHLLRVEIVNPADPCRGREPVQGWGRLSECRCELHFYFRGDQLGKYPNPYLYVTLACDFLPDINGRAVDGNFLRGDFPTGDGVEGGTFESWFRIVHLPGQAKEGE